MIKKFIHYLIGTIALFFLPSLILAELLFLLFNKEKIYVNFVKEWWIQFKNVNEPWGIFDGGC
jgi:hypothetical protein